MEGNKIHKSLLAPVRFLSISLQSWYVIFVIFIFVGVTLGELLWAVGLVVVSYAYAHYASRRDALFVDVIYIKVKNFSSPFKDTRYDA